VLTHDHLRFVVDHTETLAPPLVPELKLHLAVETVEIWSRTEEALGEDGLPPPFWAFAWAGGQALARHVLDHPEIVKGKHVLDFAAGGAIVGVAAMQAGAAATTASELDPFAIAAIEANARLNGVEIDTRLGDIVGTDEGWDVVLAGDVFYEAEPARQIGGWLAQLHARGATVLIGDPGRSFLPQDKLEKLAEYDAPVLRELEDMEIRRAKVWRFK
jgi:predicted nicotinamide N-methyase